MDVGVIMLNEIRRKIRWHIISLICGIWKREKKKIELMATENRLEIARDGSGARRMSEGS